MPAVKGTYTITGQAAAFITSLLTVSGSYALTGQAAVFATRMPIASAAYAITGQAAVLTPTANAASGAYAITGSAITFKINWVVASGSYAISGNPASYFEVINGAGGGKKLYRGRLEIARRKIIITDDEGRTRRVDLLRHLKPPPPFAPAPDWVLPDVPNVPPPVADALPIAPALPMPRLPQSLLALQDARDENDLVELLTNSPDPLVEDIRQVLGILAASGQLEALLENA
jgi:roadblock/LC7 domain-containing protein